MKLSDLSKVTDLLKEHGSIATLETVVDDAKAKFSVLGLADALKTKLGDALGGVVEEEKTRLKESLESLGVEVDTEVKGVLAKMESFAGSVLHKIEDDAKRLLSPAANLAKSVESAASLEWSERIRQQEAPK